MRMMEGLHVLSLEIRRIAECPYTPSLKRLHELLKDTNLPLLHRWARNNPCQIDSLARSILEGLELWPLALELLRILAYVPAFRDAALQQQPMLLHTLLAKATESDSGFDQFAPACVSLLSSPLEAAIPSTIPAFLQKLLEKAVRSQSAATIRPVYQVLSGFGPSYLDDLASEILARFQEQLDEVLKRFDSNDPFGTLLCLAVLAMFASRSKGRMGESIPANNSHITSGAMLMEPTDDSCPARKYFVGKRAVTTFNLAVFRVISVCSVNSGLRLDGALETLKLSQDIINALSSDDKKVWIASNIGRAKKLYEKILRPDIDSSLQCAALDFVIALCGGQVLPCELKATYEKAFLTPRDSTLSPQALALCIVALGPTTFSQGLSGLLSLACEDRSPNSEGVTRLDNALRTVSAMTATTYTREHLSHAICDATSSGLLYRFATQSPPRLNSNSALDPKDVCPFTYLETMTRLQRRLVVVLLSIFLRSPIAEQDYDGVSMILVEKQTQLSTAATSCSGCAGSKFVDKKSSVSLFEAGSTPRALTISHNWRENMVRELSRDANREYESVTRMVGEICRDLELRCDEAERPYQEEKIKSRNLEAKVEAARAKVAELEVKLRAQGSKLDDLEIEKDVLSKQVMTSEKRLKEQAGEIERMRHDFDQAKDASERAAQAAIEASRDQDLAYLANLTAKDDILEEQAIKLTLSESRISEVEEQIAELIAQGAKDAVSLSSNKTLIRELNEDIATANELVATKQLEVDRLTESEALVNVSKEEAATRAQQASDQKDSTIFNLSSRLEAANNRVEEVQHEYDMYTSTKESVILRLRESHKTSYETLQAELEKTRDDAAITHEETVSRIVGLQNKVRILRKEREEQGRKLAEAQELGNKFMAVVGNTNALASPLGIKPRSSAFEMDGVLSCDGSSAEKRANRSNPTSPLGSVASSLNGPTPKRTKTRRTSQARRTQGPMGFKIPTAAKTTRRHTMRSGRTPLTDLGPTHIQGPFSPTQRISWEKSPKTIIDLEVSRENQDVPGWTSDDESFGGRDIFTSTNQQQLSALSKPPKTPQMHNDSFNETTTDF